MIASIITFFLIDDDKDDQEIFGLALKQTNLPVMCETADDGYLALQRFEEDPAFMPDLIFLDLNMPRINGVQCLAEIKKNPRLKHIPVIIYSTSSSEIDREATTLLGAEGFITKLTDLDTLSQTLLLILENQFKHVFIKSTTLPYEK